MEGDALLGRRRADRSIAPVEKIKFQRLFHRREKVEDIHCWRCY